MSINSKQQLIDLIKVSLVEDLSKIQEIVEIRYSVDGSEQIQNVYPKKQLELQAERLANVMIEYVNSELENLLNYLKLQNAYTISNTNLDSNSTGLLTGITVVPSQIINFRPLITKE